MDQILSRAETIRLRLLSYSCLNIFWAFIFTIITFTFANSAYAISLSDHVITENFQSDTTCTKPVEKSSFKTTDSKVYSWVHLLNASPFDRVTWRWINPDNSVYATTPWTVGVQGSTCAAAWMGIAGQPAASMTGTWKTEIYMGNILAATDTFSIGVPEQAAVPKVTFSPPESESLMGGEVFDLVFQIESSTTPMVTTFSMSYNGSDITQTFFAWLNSGFVKVSVNGNLITVTFPGISLPSGLNNVSVTVGNPNGTTTATWSMNMTLPKYTPSATQNDILNTYGNPDYLSILFNTDQLRREETWTYVGLGKMYLFWDGVKVGEKSVGIDTTLYMNPPMMDPTYFTDKTTLADLTTMFGMSYTVTDASTEEGDLTDMNLKSYYFEEKGLLASFFENQLVIVQTIDLNVDTSESLNYRALQETNLENSDLTIGLNNSDKRIDPIQAIAWAIYVGILSIDPNRDQQRDNSICLGNCLRNSTNCKNSIKCYIKLLGAGNAAYFANLGMHILAGSGEFIDTAKTDCDADPPKNGDGITCPGKCEYTYTPWSDCKEDNTQTREVSSKKPEGCSGTPNLTQACTYTPPACEFTYSEWSECQPDGKKTRTYTKHPDGCVGEPTEPLEQTCTPTQDCTRWEYSKWSDCQADGYQYRTARGYPDGCVGSPPEELSKSCTPTQECVAWDYTDWSECQSNGYQYRTVTRRYPEGCVGDGETVQPCDYHPPCTGYDYSDSGCQPSNLYGIGLGAITRTYRGIPEGCVGGINIPQTEYICCSLDPC
jgi:hypothetical protein